MIEKHTTVKGPDSSGPSYNDETIAALASGFGGAIAVIRISGREIDGNIKTILDYEKLKNNPRKALLLRVSDPGGGVIDESVVLYYPAPHSFTGEHVVEVMCHGGPYIIKKILTALFSCGVRQAEPGEFTRRAFLNGKMDLTAAEGIKELVGAESEGEFLAAHQLMDGRLQRTIVALRAKIIKAMAYLEATIDFPDEGDMSDIHKDTAEKLCREVKATMVQLVDEYDSGRITSQGLRLALVGPANAGKSTMLNYFLDKERAIVTEVAGTTRDYLEERCLIKGRLTTMIDTAGIRETADKVEAIGVESSLKWLGESDLSLVLVPYGMLEKDFRSFKQQVESRAKAQVLYIGTMRDLGENVNSAQLDHNVSCHNGEGMDGLYSAIAAFVDRHVDAVREKPFLTNARQKAHLARSSAALTAFFTSYEAGEYEECLAFELQQAADALEAVVGRIENDDILEKIFSDFCVGK